MNKNLIKSIACITCGLGIATSIPFITTSCAQKDKALPDDVYDLYKVDGAYGISGFTQDFLNNQSKYSDCNVLSIPERVKGINVLAINENAFINPETALSTIPKYINKVCLPYDVKDIGENAFLLSNIQNLSIDRKNLAYGLATNLGKNCQVLIQKDTAGNCLWTNESEVVGCLATGEVDFRFDPSVTKISSEKTFFGTSIVNLHLSNSITEIGQGAFAYCPIKALSIDKKNTKYGLATNLGDKCKVLVSTKKDGKWAWVNSESDKSAFQCIAEGSLAIGDVVFPKDDVSIQRIAENAFTGTNINSIDFSSSINNIDDSHYMFNLKELTFNSSSIKLSNQCFELCFNLSKITWNDLPNSGPTITLDTHGAFAFISEKGKVISTSKDYTSVQLLDYLKENIECTFPGEKFYPFQNWEAAK